MTNSELSPEVQQLLKRWIEIWDGIANCGFELTDEKKGETEDIKKELRYRGFALSTNFKLKPCGKVEITTELLGPGVNMTPEQIKAYDQWFSEMVLGSREGQTNKGRRP